MDLYCKALKMPESSPKGRHIHPTENRARPIRSCTTIGAFALVGGIDTQALPNERIAPDIERSRPPAIVQKIDVNDESYSYAFRGQSLSIDGIPVRINHEFLLGQILTPDTILTDREIRKELLNIAKGLDDEKLMRKFSDPTLTSRDLIDVLEYASNDEYVHFMRRIVTHLGTSRDAREFFQGKFDNALEFASTDEKILLAERWLHGEDSSKRFDAVAAVIRSSESWVELTTLVSFLGQETLLSTENEEILEYTALAAIGKRLSNVEFPEQLSTDAPEEEIATVLESLQASLAEQKEALTQFSGFKGTDAYSEYSAIVRYNLRYLEQDLKNASTDTQKVRLINTIMKKIDIECTYGVKLTHQEKFLMSSSTRWDEGKLSQVETALKILPEGVLLTTPRLSTIQLTSTIMGRRSILGLRRSSDGAILLAEHAFTHSGIAALYPNVKPGTAVLVHEIGHSVQLGRGSGGLVQNEDGTWRFGDGDLRYDFDEYVQSTGWKVFAPGSYELTNAGYSVKIDEEEYLMDTPVRIDDKLMVLTMYGNTLIAHQAEGQFTIDPYGRVNPFEDWAEAFTEYFLNPSRLQKFAPDKFEHLQQEFGMYR